ncbi:MULTISPECIES: ATP-grasp domain-containing protein [Niastella]|uniref:ATP-grasp domain-containing protein n=1 Tax=Niastella soli TaxID=2821487 RepID=A0ABS3YZJ5_9BACT|nr:ATP-grasp domain-containing protein [Niastella soli]MBO9203348.1 ATP-grasp domain-containing protein [Niastella soli]
MNPTYNNIQWVIQRNLTNTDDLSTLKLGCEKIGVDAIEIDIIPFTPHLPEFNKDKQSIFYGSTTMGQLIYKDNSLNKGFFFDSNSFSIANYFDKWGTHMLNFGAMVTSFNELMAKDHDADKLFFIRPDDDSKSFSGEVKKYSEIKNWYHKLKMFDNTSLSLDSKIVVSEPYHLRYEWRLWIVNKQVIAASKYREDFKLKKERGCPQEVIQFAEQRCQEYTPHNLFVMDICETGDSYYIVECGCLNSAGFYAADIPAIVSSVTDHFYLSLL